jgi:DNA-binding beta-propeller fold protein YncE
MDRARTSQAQRTRTASTVRAPLRLLLALAVAVMSLLASAPAASAFKVVSEAGEGAGQTQEPQGVAVDYETGRLYVADTGNNRVDVFDKNGTFEMAFGWGVANGANKLETCTTTTGCQAGVVGHEEGEFNRPTEIAVDNSPTSSSRHDVYVVDRGNARIEKFTEKGEFELAFGSEGEGEGQFSTAGNILVGAGPAGIVYVVDIKKVGGTAGDETTRLQRFQPSGAEIAPQQILQPVETFGASALAVDPNGDFYLSMGGAVRKYELGDDTQIAEIANPFEEGMSESIATISVDPEEDLFVADSAHTVAGPAGISIIEFDPAGNRLRRFGYGSFHNGTKNLAPYHSASGDIYASEPFDFSAGAPGYRVLQLNFPAPGPLVFPGPCEADSLGNTKATLSAEVNPEGKVTTAHFQYVDQHSFETEGGFNSPHTKTTAESASLGSDFTLHEASAEAPLVPSTKYHCRVVATNADAPAGIEGEEGSFESLPPLEIGSTSVSDVGTEAATLNAAVNPLGIPTTGFFEYVTEATYQHDVAELGPGHGFDHASKAPDTGQGEEPINFHAGESLQAGSAQISGLAPGTAYRYRIVAADSFFPAGFPGPTETFRTFSPGEGVLPDERAYELVSPAQKNSAEVAVPGVAGGLFDERSVRIQAAAGSGETVTYTSWTSFGTPEGAPSTSQYLSKRTPSGWVTENISPGGFQRDILRISYRGFTPDLGFGAFVISEPPLTAEAQPGFENLYLRNDETGALQALTIEAPQLAAGEGEGFCTGYAGASADGEHAIFAAKGAMAGAPVGKGFSLYEWSAAGGLALVSVLPDGTPAPPIQSASEQPGEGTGFGGVGGNCTGQGIARNAISEDGSTVFWTYGGEYEGAKQPLFARIGGKTIQLDAKPKAKPGKGPFGQGKFLAATGDGSKAFFTAPGKLTSEAEAAGGLYRYNTAARSLIDLTPGEIAPEFEGLIGSSEDGSYAYFVARGALTGEEESAAKEKAVKGANNLYLWHEGEGLRFIGALSGLDAGDWSAPGERTARVTPDGRHLAFLSIEAEALSGYDNSIFPSPAPGAGCQPGLENKLEGDAHCAEAYLYDAEANTLTCASCNPSGSRPAGPTQLPFWTNPYEGPRYLSDDGSRLFFESRDVLSASDENGKRDVYEFELDGSGTCSAASSGFNPASGGCISLISSGKSTDESYLLDASANGRDVFFSTRRSLLGSDVNENYDVYDARAPHEPGEAVAFPEAPAQPPCEEEKACKPPPVSPPSVSPPVTPSFQGPGNTTEKFKPAKHKQQKKKSKHKGKKKHAGTSHRRRAGR